MELNINQALQQGILAHREGKLKEAERLYRAILQSEPLHPDANHNLGILIVSSNKAASALPLLKTALQANPKIEQFWFSYIDALIKEKQFENAEKVLKEAEKKGLAENKINELKDQLKELFFDLKNQKPDHIELYPAIELREAGEYQKAQEWLNKFIEVHPNEPEVLSLLSQVLLLDKKDTEAEKVLSIAASLNSDLPSIFRNQARLLLRQSKFVEALEKGQSGYEISPYDPESSVVLAACLAANQRDEEALPLIEKIIEVRPNYAEAFANRAMIRLRKKDIVGSIKDLEVTVSLKPHMTQMWALLGSLFQQSNNLLGATEAMRKAHLNEPNNVDYMAYLGEFLRQQNEVKEAISMLENATKLDPKNARAWTNLGVALQQDENVDNAKKSYEKALEINPKSAEVLSNLGAIAKDAEDWNSSLKYFKEALKIKPDYAEGHSNLGVTLQELGRLEEAEASYMQSIELKPDYAEAFYSLGVVLEELGRLEKAESSYSQAIALKPDFADALNNLGNILQKLGRLEESEAYYARAVDAKPNFSEAHFNLGIVFQELGRLEESEASYSQAILFKPDLSEAHNRLGDICNETGRLKEAEESYRKAIAIKPDYTEAYNSLLKCLYLLDKQSLFSNELDYLIEQDKINAVISSLTYRSALKYGLNKPNLFCEDPLKYVLHTDLNTQYDFKEIFAEKARSILNDKRVSARKQALLVNGYQTSGNLFDIENDFTEEIQKIIQLEIEKYRINFKNSKEGLIKKWPTNYSLYGWLICMKSGGELKPHIHDEGWLSGSIYINVPSKLKVDSGNLVVSIGEEKDVTDIRKNEKIIINVVTGSLVLFPGSLTHYTIPFSAEEERIVLAFDVRRID